MPENHDFFDTAFWSKYGQKSAIIDLKKISESEPKLVKMRKYWDKIGPDSSYLWTHFVFCQNIDQHRGR